MAGVRRGAPATSTGQGKTAKRVDCRAAWVSSNATKNTRVPAQTGHTNMVHINRVSRNLPTQRNMKIAETRSTDCTAETTRPVTRARGKTPESLLRTSRGVGKLQSLQWYRIKTKKNVLEQMRLPQAHVETVKKDTSRNAKGTRKPDFLNRRAHKVLLMNRCHHFRAAAWPRRNMTRGTSQNHRNKTLPPMGALT